MGDLKILYGPLNSNWKKGTRSNYLQDLFEKHGFPIISENPKGVYCSMSMTARCGLPTKYSILILSTKL